ncbi:hypothetical protein KIPB_000378 [Kipferlia bialata]|uniref:NACHT domain-containing protein n=1 Tax=Kipferlia bialata TaxID=797122 RepID=A0A391NI31_9EUKA|nr:hypothetical protein KIPB_000378 [Kipferlia bialata]|eukprot:g378.t1
MAGLKGYWMRNAAAIAVTEVAAPVAIGAGITALAGTPLTAGIVLGPLLLKVGSVLVKHGVAARVVENAEELVKGIDGKKGDYLASLLSVASDQLKARGGDQKAAQGQLQTDLTPVVAEIWEAREKLSVDQATLQEELLGWLHSHQEDIAGVSAKIQRVQDTLDACLAVEMLPLSLSESRSEALQRLQRQTLHSELGGSYDKEQYVRRVNAERVIHQFLRQTEDRYRKTYPLLVLGGARGMGRTWTSLHTAYACCEGTLPGNTVPFVTILRNGFGSLDTVFNTSEPIEVANKCMALYGKGKTALIVLDGLDEVVVRSDRKKMLQWVESFLKAVRGLALLILTSETTDWDSCPEVALTSPYLSQYCYRSVSTQETMQDSPVCPLVEMGRFSGSEQKAAMRSYGVKTRHIPAGLGSLCSIPFVPPLLNHYWSQYSHRHSSDVPVHMQLFGTPYGAVSRDTVLWRLGVTEKPVASCLVSFLSLMATSKTSVGHDELQRAWVDCRDSDWAVIMHSGLICIDRSHSATQYSMAAAFLPYLQWFRDCTSVAVADTPVDTPSPSPSPASSTRSWGCQTMESEGCLDVPRRVLSRPFDIKARASKAEEYVKQHPMPEFQPLCPLEALSLTEIELFKSEYQWFEGLHSYITVSSGQQYQGLQGQTLGVKESLIVSRALLAGCHVRELYLSENFLGSSGAIAIAQAFPALERLQQLNLTDNNIGLEGINAIAAGLRYLPNLEELRLGMNTPGPEGALVLAENLKFVPKLRKLYLFKSHIGSKGTCALAGVLPQGIQTLHLSECDIDSEAVRILMDSVKRRRLEKLCLAGNGFGDEGATALAHGLKSCHHLVWLDISHNGISDVAANVIAESIRRTRLITVNLDGNDVGHGVRRHIYNILARHY